MTIALSLLGFCAAAQDITFGDGIPASAVKILRPRMEAMLRSAGMADVPLKADAVVTDRMETSGSMAQTALTVNLILQSGEVRESFILKGVGDDEADAFERAMKQFLPRSKDVLAFLEKLKL